MQPVETPQAASDDDGSAHSEQEDAGDSGAENNTGQGLPQTAINGTLRHADCLRFQTATDAKFVGGMCCYCRLLPKVKTLQKRVKRQAAAAAHDSHKNFRCVSSFRMYVQLYNCCATVLLCSSICWSLMLYPASVLSTYFKFVMLWPVLWPVQVHGPHGAGRTRARAASAQTTAGVPGTTKQYV
jgi:hypothetical protein